MAMLDTLSALGDALATIPDVRVYEYLPDTIAAPAAVVPLPRLIEFDATMNRGSDRLELDVTLLVPRSDDRASSLALGPYLDPSGPSAVKAAIDNHTTAAWDTARVMRAESIGEVAVGAVAYLGARFTVEVVT